MIIYLENPLETTGFFTLFTYTARPDKHTKCLAVCLV